jgi:hypothetical protein
VVHFQFKQQRLMTGGLPRENITAHACLLVLSLFFRDARFRVPLKTNHGKNICVSFQIIQSYIAAVTPNISQNNGDKQTSK